MSGQNQPGEKKAVAPWNPNTSLTSPRTLAEAQDLAKVFVMSGFFKDTVQLSQGIVKVMYGQELGLSPMVAMTQIDVVEGRPAPSAALVLALIEKHDDYDYEVEESTPEVARLAFYRITTGGDRVLRGTASFTIQDAQRAGLASRKNWQSYPEDMLFNRAVTRGARRYCPGLFQGIAAYTPEELGAQAPPERVEVGNVSFDMETGEVIEGAVVVDTDDEPGDDSGAEGERGAEEAAQGVDEENVAAGEWDDRTDPDDGHPAVPQEPQGGPDEGGEGSSPSGGQEGPTDGDSVPDGRPRRYPPAPEGMNPVAWDRWCWLRVAHRIDLDAPDEAEERKLIQAVQDLGAAPNVESFYADSTWGRVVKAVGLQNEWGQRVADLAAATPILPPGADPAMTIEDIQAGEAR